MKKILALSVLLSLNVSAQTTGNVQGGQVWTTGAAFDAAAVTPAFGTYLTPFAANSPWNSKPLNPVLGTSVVVMPSVEGWLPQIAQGEFSTGVFQAAKEDPPMTVYPRYSGGIMNPDVGGRVASITIPHWPASVVPAEGSDGHAEIVDATSGRIYSFWQLKNVDGQWKADQYSWSLLNGTGFGDPAHSNQGARAAGVPSMAGLIRKHEINDGQAVYQHALAMSLDYASLSPKIGYVYPATSTDWNYNVAGDTYKTTNRGTIPDGTRMMLPADFQLAADATPDLRKVVETLKQFGAYVVDRNYGTPYFIYVERGSDFHLGEPDPLKKNLEQIRLALRPLVSAEKWVDGNGADTADALKPAANSNVLSMRGPWTRLYGGGNGTFNSELQALEFPTPTSSYAITSQNSCKLSDVSWAKFSAGDRMRFWVYGTNKAKAQLRVMVGDYANAVVLTQDVESNQYYDFVWPAGGWCIVTAVSGVGAPSLVQTTLRKLP